MTANDASLLGARYAPPAPEGHVESFFLEASDPATRRAIWLRTTITALARRRAIPGSSDGVAFAEAWAVAFSDAGHVAVKSRVPFGDARFSRADLDVEVDGCTVRADPGVPGARTGETRGDIASGGREIAWNLRWIARGDPLVHLPRRWMYGPRLPGAKLVSPLPDLALSGTLTVGGATWNVDGWRGLLGHNWGRRHTAAYGWGHCNAWDDEPDLVLEGITARLPLGPLGAIARPLVTILCVRHHGERHDLNGFAELVRNQGELTARRWRFRGKNDRVEVDGEFSGATDDFVGLHYEDPDGTITHCLGTTLASARVAIALPGRSPKVVHSRAAALEIATRDPHHGVRMYL